MATRWAARRQKACDQAVGGVLTGGGEDMIRKDVETVEGGGVRQMEVRRRSSRSESSWGVVGQGDQARRSLQWGPLKLLGHV